MSDYNFDLSRCSTSFLSRSLIIADQHGKILIVRSCIIDALSSTEFRQGFYEAAMKLIRKELEDPIVMKNASTALRGTHFACITGTDRQHTPNHRVRFVRASARKADEHVLLAHTA